MNHVANKFPLSPKAPDGESSIERASSPTSPVDVLLGELESALHAKRRDVLGRVRDIEAALATYQRAVEERLVVQFARDHSLRVPELARVSVEAAAERLRAAVLTLPELARVSGPDEALQSADAPVPPAAASPQGVASAPPPGAREKEPATSRETPDSDASPSLPWLQNLSVDRKLVIVGGLAGRQKLGALPESLEGRTEWVDTDGGPHAIGNLPQRIRQGRVAAVVILDRAVQHKHSEPLVTAARAVGVPVGFAGKGGILSIRRALEQIDKQLKGR
jgi:hypothetical protein